MDEAAFIRLFARCRDYGMEEPGELYAPLFELNAWSAFCGKQVCLPLRDPFCFDFQQSAVEQLNKYDRPCRVLPGAVLENL